MKKEKLVVFEGIYSSGKSCQIKALSDYLISQKNHYSSLEWNTSSLRSSFVKAKSRLEFDSFSYTHMELALFSHNYTKNIIPSTKENSLTICDRYFFSGISRGLVRGIKYDYLKNMYEFAKIPDITIFIKTNPNEAFQRRDFMNKSMRDYLSGSDFLLSTDEKKNMLEYLRLLDSAYDRIFEDYSKNGNRIVIIDGNDNKQIVHEKIIDVLRKENFF